MNKRKWRKATSIILIALIAGGCGGGGGQGTTEIHQTGSDTVNVYTEEYTINNCSGKESLSQTLGHKMTVGFEGGLGVPIDIVKASVQAKYEREESASVELGAAPGTYMIYEIKWTEEKFFGEITYDGQSGLSYNVHVSKPVQSSAYDQGCIAGAYKLVRWERAASPISLNMEAMLGALRIEKSGDATWELYIKEMGTSPSIIPTISCNGRFFTGSQRLEARPGGNAGDWTAPMTSFSHDIWMTFCGWDVGGETDPFELFPHELGDGNRTLEMKNSRGVMIWELIGQ